MINLLGPREEASMIKRDRVVASGVSGSSESTNRIVTRVARETLTRKAREAVKRTNAETLRTLMMMTRVKVAVAAEANIEAQNQMMTKVRAAVATVAEAEGVNERVKMKRSYPNSKQRVLGERKIQMTVVSTGNVARVAVESRKEKRTGDIERRLRRERQRVP
jgi:hypothetical protein